MIVTDDLSCTLIHKLMIVPFLVFPLKLTQHSEFLKSCLQLQGIPMSWKLLNVLNLFVHLAVYVCACKNYYDHQHINHPILLYQSLILHAHHACNIVLHTNIIHVYLIGT